MSADTGRPAPIEGAQPRPAATIILLAEPGQEARSEGGAGEDGTGFEVLLMRRHARSGFAARAWVFPGGVVDPGDAQVGDAQWTGIDPDALADRFGRPPAEVLALHVAAVRETFEEAGVLLAHRQDGEPLDTTDAVFVEVRHALNDRGATVDWPGFLARHGLVLDLGAVTYLSRWITPAQEPRRYDTSFFVARMPAGIDASPDLVEMTESRWMTPSGALEDDGTGVIFPTEKTLELLAAFDTPDEVIAHALAQPEVAVIQPHILTDDAGTYQEIILPSDDRYPHELYR